MRGEFRRALELGEEMVAFAERAGDQDLGFNGRARIGITLAWMGEYRLARETLEQSLSSRTGRASDFSGNRGVLLFNALYHLSWVQLENRFGNPAFLSLDPFARAMILQHQAANRTDFIRDFRDSRERTELLLELSRKHGFPYYLGCALVRLGRIAVEEGKAADGIETMLEGMRTFREAGEDITHTYFAGLLAEAFLRVARGAEGLAVIEEAITRSASSGQRFCEAETHRLRGELLGYTGAPDSQSERSMRKALAVAQEQAAKSWELRAATSLARFLK